jgi:hypothetical protein
MDKTQQGPGKIKTLRDDDPFANRFVYGLQLLTIQACKFISYGIGPVGIKQYAPSRMLNEYSQTENRKVMCSPRKAVVKGINEIVSRKNRVFQFRFRSYLALIY